MVAFQKDLPSRIQDPILYSVLRAINNDRSRPLHRARSSVYYCIFSPSRGRSVGCIVFQYLLQDVSTASKNSELS